MVALAQNLNVYYVPPPMATKRAIVVLYDVFGLTGGRTRSVCDALAREVHSLSDPAFFCMCHAQTKLGVWLFFFLFSLTLIFS